MFSGKRESKLRPEEQVLRDALLPHRSDCLRATVDRFIARENIKHYRRELENGVGEPTRATMLRLLVEEENHLGHTREQLTKLDRHISLLSEIMARQVDLIDKLQSLGSPLERAPMVLATLNDLMAVYLKHRETITAALADGKAREG
jgi:hypothetical protein